MKVLDQARAIGRFGGVGAALLSTLVNLMAPAAMAEQDVHHHHPRTPIKHVIVIIGENRSFDHVYATYQSPSGDSVSNLLSKGIVNADGTPGPKYARSTTLSAVDSTPDPFLLSPPSKAAYSVLPVPLTDGAPKTPYIPTAAEAQLDESGLLPADEVLLTTGATGLASRVPDTRIANVTNLPPGPFQLTGATLPYDSYSASPVHRFYQMWQQMDCDASSASRRNPSGCKADLFPYVEVTVGAGGNGEMPPAGFSTEWSSTGTTTGEGSTAMGFYNVQQGDAPYMKQLADQYTLNDNFHQSIMGGTGANHIALGTGDAIYYSDGNGKALTPPHNQMVGGGMVDEIENPNPADGNQQLVHRRRIRQRRLRIHAGRGRVLQQLRRSEPAGRSHGVELPVVPAPAHQSPL